MKYTGSLQGMEFSAFDVFLLNYPNIEIDNRIVIIGETELDIQRFGHPLSDDVLANSLQIIEENSPRVIGVDKYRDTPVAPGTNELNRVLKKYHNIVWIFFAGNKQKDFISAPHVLNNNPERVAFNDVIEDFDGVSRRGLLMMDINNNTYYSFPLLLALYYLAAEDITATSDEKGWLKLNDVSFPKIDSNFGAYQHADAGQYQIMQDYPGLPQSFSFFTLSDLMDKKIPADALKNKIVLVGGTALSLNDYRLLPNKTKCFGVEHHAYFISQLLNSAIKGKSPLQTWSDNTESFWLCLWGVVGGLTGFYRGNVIRLTITIIVEFSFLIGSMIVFLNQGWWIPLIAPLLSWSSSLAVNMLYFSAQERVERQQLMQLFASHVSPEIATKLWQKREQFFNGGVYPDSLVATVLFTDISNFTTITEKTSPAVLIPWLNEYMEEMSRLVNHHEGIVNKYIGDAIMAVFGIPVKRNTVKEIEMDAKNAVLCAMAFNKKLRELNQKWEKEGLPIITMRVGIYTGLLVAGSFGGLMRMEYTVIGDTVNIASRLESFDKTIAPPDANNPCRILIGQSTFDYIKDFYPAEIVGECQLKGKNEFSKIYQVMAL